MSSGLLQFESISPSVLFAIFLPALIVPSGFGLKWHTVEQVLWKALSMAVFGTLINCGLIAIVAYYVLPYDWEWSQSWLFAAILSATDPVAVVAIMQVGLLGRQRVFVVI
jgi:NhaP-type Na+/H+ or K+/H+ antiporter